MHRVILGGIVLNTSASPVTNSLVSLKMIKCDHQKIHAYYEDRDQQVSNLYTKTDEFGFFYLPMRVQPQSGAAAATSMVAELSILKVRTDSDGYVTGYDSAVAGEMDLYKIVDWSKAREGILPEVKKLDGTSHQIQPHIEVPHKKLSKMRDCFVQMVKATPEYIGFIGFDVLLA